MQDSLEYSSSGQGSLRHLSSANGCHRFFLLGSLSEITLAYKSRSGIHHHGICERAHEVTVDKLVGYLAVSTVDTIKRKNKTRNEQSGGRNMQPLQHVFHGNTLTGPEKKNIKTHETSCSSFPMGFTILGEEQRLGSIWLLFIPP